MYRDNSRNYILCVSVQAVLKINKERKMSLGKAEKEFWIKDLTRSITVDMDNFVLTCDNPNILNRARELARERVLDLYEIRDMLSSYEKLEAQKEELEKERMRINDQMQKLNSEMRNNISLKNSEFAEQTVLRQGYRNYWNWEDIVSARGQAEMPYVLESEFGQTGITVSRYMKALDELPKTVMMASSPSQLRTFLIRFGEMYSIDIPI